LLLIIAAVRASASAPLGLLGTLTLGNERAVRDRQVLVQHFDGLRQRLYPNHCQRVRRRLGSPGAWRSSVRRNPLGGNSIVRLTNRFVGTAPFVIELRRERGNDLPEHFPDHVQHVDRHRRCTLFAVQFAV